jgi:AcrR family transcriptional regulator
VVAQVKKEQVREAILRSAYELFREKGFINCPMSEIARAAGTSVANLYVYFPSKLQLFYEVYAPIITSRLMKLASDAQNMDDREERLRFILQTLWRDIPKEDNAFARNLIQAIATTSTDVDKPHEPLKWNVEFIHDLILSCLPEQRRFLFQDSTVSFLVWMAFDGFAINVGRGEDRDFDKMVEHFADMLLGKGAP